MNVVKKMGVVASLALVSSLSVADNVYDLSGMGEYFEYGDEWAGVWEYQLDIVTGVEGLFTDEFIITVPKGFFWSLDAESFAYQTDVSEFFSIEFGENISDVWDEPSGGRRGPATLADSRSDVVGIYENIYGEVFERKRVILPGTYSLFVSGNSVSSLGEYELEIELFQASPVPEPSSIALMLGGLGLVGFMAARRRQQS